MDDLLEAVMALDEGASAQNLDFSTAFDPAVLPESTLFPSGPDSNLSVPSGGNLPLQLAARPEQRTETPSPETAATGRLNFQKVFSNDFDVEKNALCSKRKQLSLLS